MDRKTGLPPSGSIMGNNALRIKNKLFTASAMTNLRPSASLQKRATQGRFISPCEGAAVAHIITLVPQLFVIGLKPNEPATLLSRLKRRPTKRRATEPRRLISPFALSTGATAYSDTRTTLG